jgi:hypothetical protein
MSATLGMWEEVGYEEEERLEEEPLSYRAPPAAREQFAEEQILGLIRGLFFARPKVAHQVVFSGVYEDAGSGEVCMRIADVLANQTSGRVCILETSRGPDGIAQEFGGPRTSGGDTPDFATGMRESPLQLRGNLWLMPAGVWRNEQGVATFPWIRRRLRELRGEFEYAVIHAPPVGACDEAETLAQLTDGLVLVLEAHRTRRMLARMTRQKLQAAHVQVLGAVLSGRTFPIPEALYRRL